MLPWYSVQKWTSIKDTVRCFMHHTIYHCITCTIYLTRVWVLAAKKICAWACIWQTHCCERSSPVKPPVTRSLNEESGELRWPHDWFGNDLIQISSVAFHSFLGRILVRFSCRAWQVCELLHWNVVLWCYSRTPDERPPSPTTIPLIRPHFVWRTVVSVRIRIPHERPSLLCDHTNVILRVVV